MKKDPTAFRERFKAWKDGKDPYRYLYDNQSGNWSRITNDENADAFANFVATPNGSRPTFSMYENTPNPTLPVSKNEFVVPDNTLWTRQLVEKANNTRTWRSDAADVAHAIGEGALLSTTFMSPEIEPLVYPTYQMAKLVAANAIKNEFAPTIISSMMKPSVNKMPSVINRFRNQEWSNFLSTTNGDNYYRIARNAKMLNPDEKYFFSHTTPWEEFSGLGSEFPSGAKRLYAFPTKTFGKLNATTHTGLETPESVVDMGTKHLLYGNTSSGLRGPVRVLSDKNAELLEMDPFINGTLERPRLPNGFYDKNPNYENIYLGNQTTIDGNTANQALQNATHTVYYPTQGGVQKELYLTPRKTSTPTLISWEDAQKPLSAKQIFPNETGKGWLNATANRLGVNVNHYYNNVITPEELMKAVKSNGYESFISGKTFTEPAYIPSGFPYGLDKAKILMPYEEIRKMPMMAKYADLPEAEFRKIADDLIGSHEFIHWWNRLLAKNINSGRMKVPSGYQPHELTWIGDNLPAGIDEKALGKTLGYMSEMNGTESNARLGQIFNAFGIKKGLLQPLHLNLALKFYRKVFPDNQMSIFLNAIKDKDALVKFANENAGTLFGTGAAITTASNTNKYAE